MNTDPDDNKNDGKPPSGRSSTVSTTFFWLIVIVGIPLTIIYARLPKDDTTLTQGGFQKALLERRITELSIIREDGVNRSVKGEYRPDEKASAKSFTANVIVTERLMEQIEDNFGDASVVDKSSVWASALLQLLFFVLIIGAIYFLFARQLKGAGKGAMQFGKSRARLNQSLDKITFRDVAGISEAKEEVEEIIDFLRDPQKFHRLGGHIPRGVLLVGPPGTGKTLLARAIAGEADVPFFNISGSDFVEMFVGVGASRVRDMFEQGKKNSPCIIFIDEIDAVGRSRFSGIGGGHDEREQTLNALLVEMDGFEGNSGVIIVAATNRPDVLDKALLRPGRFDRQIVIDLPDLKGREHILKVHAKKVKMNVAVDLNRAARGTPGFSGADLANLINEAALLAAREGKNEIDMSDLEEARDKVRFGKERRSRVISEHERKITAYHEAGHALCGLHCEHSTPLHKVTIIPRGNAFLGAAHYLPVEDRFTSSRSELQDQLVVSMGGRYAEEIIFGEITNGASMDISQASDIARRMVCQWGMSDLMGPLAYGSREEPVYVGRGATKGNPHSEDTARELDLEIRKLIDGAAQRAKTILTENQDQLEKLGAALLENETMSADEICDLLGMDRKSNDPMSENWDPNGPGTGDGPPPAPAADEETTDTSSQDKDSDSGLGDSQPAPA